jgi:hypothetical protein
MEQKPFDAVLPGKRMPGQDDMSVLRAINAQVLGGIGAMISVSQCADYADLDPSELLIGVAPSAKHYSLLASYLLNLWRGGVVVRNMIRADLRAFIDLGAQDEAADLLLVLRLFLSGYPEARGRRSAAIDGVWIENRH